MRNLVRISVISIAMLVLSVMPVQAHGVGGWGPVLLFGLGLGAVLTAPYYYSHPYYPYYEQPIYQQPQIYVQPSPQRQSKPTYWYYCPEPQGYYPYVKRCSSRWMKVVPTPPDE